MERQPPCGVALLLTSNSKEYNKMKQQVGRPRGVLFSGNANNGANAGFVYANSNNTPSNTNANIGSHLCLVKIDGGQVRLSAEKRTAALPLGKKLQVNPKGVGRKVTLL